MCRDASVGAVRRLRTPLVLALAALAACADGDDPTDPDLEGPGLDPDVPPVVAWTGWRPSPGLTWTWQLQGDVPTDRAVDAYDIDLFDPPDATFAALNGRGIRVICYLSAGSWEEWRDDAAAFPSAVRGRPLDGWPGERWLDIRSPRVVETRAADGIVCVHWYWPPSKPGGVEVILFHGNGCGQRVAGSELDADTVSQVEIGGLAQRLDAVDHLARVALRA